MKRLFDNDDELKGWMQELAALPLEDSRLPGPAHLWWKAELLRRWNDQRRASEPMEIGETVQAGVGVVGAIVLLSSLVRAGLEPILLLVLGVSIVVLFLVGLLTLGVRD